MIQSDTKERILAILRDKSLAGSNREISVDAPLGEAGIGLDSLALVQFITALESEFKLIIPDEIWIERGQINLKEIIKIIDQPDKILSESNPPSQTKTDYNTENNLLEKIVSIFRNRGLIKGTISLIGRSFSGLARMIYESDRYLILEFDLQNQAVPNYQADKKIIIREATNDDLNNISELWPKNQRSSKMETIRKRIRSGYSCFIAINNGDIVAIDWVTDKENYEPYTGINIKLKEDTCYGFDLYEKAEIKGHGVGLATLAYSLRESEKTGYKRQVTVVHEANNLMLKTAIQLFGFRQIGIINTKRILRSPNSSWNLNNHSGKSQFLSI